VNLDDLDRDRPDLGCEPQQARSIARNLQLDETAGLVAVPQERCPVRAKPALFA